MNLRTASRVAAVVGAIGAVGFMLRAGRHNRSVLLLFLFAIWVLSPFVVFLLADGFTKRWSVVTRATLHTLMLVIALVSLVIYGEVALGPARAKTAPVFVVVPPASWLLMATVVPLAALLSRRKKNDY